MKKKIIVIMLISAIAIGCLAGCKVKVETPLISEPNLASGASVDASNGDGAKAIDKSKSSAWTAKEQGDYIALDFGKEISFNAVVIQEQTDNVNEFTIDVWENGSWETIYQQDRIMAYRTCYVEEQRSTKVRIKLNKFDTKVAIRDIAVYDLAERSKDFRVSEYLVLDKDYYVANKDNEGFRGNFNVVTDVILIGGVRADSEGKLKFYDFKNELNYDDSDFIKNLKGLRHAFGKNKVNIWIMVNIDQGGAVETSKFLDSKLPKLLESMKNMVTKFGVYGIDFDWEYPNKGGQWKNYSKLIVETAKFTKVTVALPPWGVGLSKDAIKALEYTNVMTYDIFDKRGDHSNVYNQSIEAICYMENLGFTRKQIHIGLPSYGRTADKSGAAWPTYKEFRNQLGKWGNIVENYRYTEKGESKTSTGFINGYAMTRDKVLAAMLMDCGGVMMFRMLCDAPYTNNLSLHHAVEEVLDNL